MQQSLKSNKINLKSAVMGSLWVIGLLAAGSDGPCMPWINLAGLFVFFMTSVVMGKLLRQMGEKTSNRAVSHVKFYRQKTGSYKVEPNHRIPIRCTTLG